MIIEEEDFKLESCGEASHLFDLELLYTINKGKEKERNEFKNAGYGLTLNTAIKKVITYRIEQKKEVFSLKEFLKEFKDELKKIKDLCLI